MIKEVGEDTFASTNITRVLSTPGFRAGIIHKYVGWILVSYKLKTVL